MVVLSQPVLTSGFFKLVALGNQHVWTEPRVASITALSELRGTVALVRRFFRVFRFLESFRAAHVIYTSFYAPAPALFAPPVVNAEPPSPPETLATSAKALGEEKEARANGANGAQEAELKPQVVPALTHTHGPHCRHHQARAKTTSNNPPAEAWLDIFGRTFNGMYLLLETLTLGDALQLPGLPLWGAAWAPILHVEGQRFWLLALACGVLSGLLKIVKLVAYGPVPQTGEGYGGGGIAAAADETKDMPEWQRQREKMRRVVYARREARRAWKGEIRTRGYALARRCVADLFDMPVPGSVVGWVRVEPGTVGMVMVVSTWLTGVEVWERCGREIGRVV